MDHDNNKMVYTGRVLIGNWFDRFQREREQQAKIEQMRANGELPEQRMERLMSSLNRPEPLLAPPGPPLDCIQMNQQLQLHCPEVADMRYYLEGRMGCLDEPIPFGPRQLGLVVAATVSHFDFENNEVDKIDDGCAVCCSPVREPSSRNIFIVRPVGMSKRGQDNTLTYGREFYLELAHACRNLYLRSETPLIDGEFGPKYHNPVRLSVLRDGYAKWRAFYWNKQYRFETEGAPVQPCARVVIQHVMTGLCLAAEGDVWHKSLLGYEAGISVHTYRDVDHIETSECIWNFLVATSTENDTVDMNKCKC